MNKRNMIAVGFFTIGLSFALAQAPEVKTYYKDGTSTDQTYRNAKNEICENFKGKVQCLSERAYHKEQLMRERRARSYREALDDRVD